MQNALAELLVKSDMGSLVKQLGIVFGYTLFLVYLTAFVTRSSTFIKSHGWLVLETIIASVLVLACLQMLIVFELRGWRALLLVVLWSLPVDWAIRIIDRGRSLVDIRASNKALLHTDHRLIRRAAMLSLIIAYMMVESLFPKG